MTREEFSTMVLGLKGIYADPKFIADKFAMEIWYSIFKDYDVDTINRAVIAYINNDNFGKAPVPGQIIACIETDAGRISEQEAWDMTYRAISRSNYFADEEFAKLPRECQMAIGSPNNMRQLAMMEIETVQSVEKSHFLRNYRIAVEKIRAEQRKPEYIKDRIADNGGVKGIGTDA